LQTPQCYLVSPIDVLISEILPDWLLSLGYWARRALFLRRRQYQLVPQEDGWFRLADAGAGYPHQRVEIISDFGREWRVLELRGRFSPPITDFFWEVAVERPREGDSLVLDLPYRLIDLKVKISPAPSQSVAHRIELREIGLLEEGLTTAKELWSPGARLALRWVHAPLSNIQAARDLADYRRWFRGFETPSREGEARLQSRALGPGARFSLVLAPGEHRSSAELETQLRNRVQVCRQIEEATGDFVLPLESGVVLASHALEILGCVLLEDAETDIAYADDDLVDASGERRGPSFKPAWSPELVRSRNVLRGLVAIRRSLIPSDFRGPVDAARRYALILACSERAVPSRIRRIPLVLASVPERVQRDAVGEEAAVTAHLKRMGIEASVAPGLAPGLRRIRYALPRPVPRVSIIVPTKNSHRLVETCVHSVRRYTDYPDYEIVLVDNGSDDPESLSSFESLAASGKVRLLRDPRAFNFAAINNEAVRQTSGELVCLLNNDVEATHADWLEEMASLALQREIGAVGAMLFYPNGTVQHGGVLLGFYGAARHAYLGAPGNSPGWDQQLVVRREVSAVTAACLVVKRSLFEQVGGFDAGLFPVGFNDVDFCLKLHARGLRNVWTPHARLIHHESATRGRDITPEQRARHEAELGALRARWGSALHEDPYHSPNLVLDSAFPRLAWPPRVRRPWLA
jgi:O-antigen biosynthesis protein